MPSVTTTTSPLSSSGSKDGLSEREPVLLKKFGGDLPLPSRTKQQEDSANALNGISNDWPGMVLGGTGGDLDGGVGGGVALAVHRSSDTANGGSSQGGKKKEKVDAGIAPWLSADMGGDFGAPEPISPTSRPTAKPSQPPLNHSPSAPHLSGYSPPGGSPSNSNHNSFSRARQSTVAAISSSAPDKRRPGSKDGVERAGGGGGGGRDKPPGPLVPLPANGGEDKRKKSGFLGGLGLIKRKATKSKEEIRTSSRSQSIAAPKQPDPPPVPHTRAGSSGLALPPLPHGSTPSSGIFSSKPSRDVSPSEDLKNSTSSRKGSKKPSSDRGPGGSSSRQPAPSEGLSGMFALDLDLDHMEGIVNPSFASTSQPSTPGGGGPITGGGLGGEQNGPASTGSSSSVDSKSGGAWTDGLSHTTHSSTSSSYIASSTRRPTHTDISPVSPFNTRDPFALPPSTNTIGPNQRTPPSPHTTQTMKGTGPMFSSQPRRPSQLRNVNSPSEELGNPFDMNNPVGSSSLFKTEFSNPFAGATSSSSSSNAARANHLWEVDPTTQPPYDPSALIGALSPRSQPPPVTAPPIQPLGGAAFNAAWVAPESWGVEGDQEDEDEDSTDEDGDGPSMGIMDILSGGKKTKNRASSDVKDLVGGVGGKEENDEVEGTIFGAGGSGSGSAGGPRPMTSGSSSGKRPGTGGARPGTGGGRPGTGGRQGTSASGQSGPMNYLRVYKSDGTYSTIQCQLMSSTTEILNILTAKTTQAKAGYRLFIRERSSDRPLDAREKPALIQRRRLLQAGFNESDRIEELGMEDLSLLCSFIYRMPKLPSVDSTEEDSFDSFEYVDLSSRDLQVFPIFLHRHAGTIVHLNLSKNPLQELPSDFIQDCTTLRELRMSHMALKRVPPSIRQSISLTRLDVSCNRIADLDQAGFEDIPGLMSIKVQNNRLSVLPSYFGHLKALKYLNISNNAFDVFPSIVCEIPTLLDLDVSFNALTYLPSEIGKLVNLERLVIVGNVIVTLPCEFTRLENLREFDCRRNQIVDFTAAYALPKLEVLKAEKNDVKVVEAQFGPKMRDINLSNNSITKISLSILAADSPSYGLTNLDLSFAKLSSIADEALAQLVSLATLKLDGNQFVQLPESIGNLSLLKELHCTDNILVSLPEGLSKLQNLLVVNVHNNNLKELPASLWLCSSLATLNVSSNLLETFPDPPPVSDRIQVDENGRKSSVSSGTQTPTGKLSPPLGLSLRQLYLADNRLGDDVFDPISLLSELSTLNLSFNEISEIPEGTLRKNTHLVALYLSGNKLTSIPAEDLTNDSQELRILHLNGNKLQSLPAELSAVVNLKVLDVGSNVLKYNINNWRFDWNWTKNIELRYFNLSGNKRLEIKPNERNQYDNSTTPDIANFNSLSHLRVLGLMDITLRIPLPDEGDDRRVRTSFSEVNNMAYGISDTLGKYEHMLLSDMVVPQFRGKENESLFGIFGRAHTSTPTLIARVKSYVAEWFAPTFSEQLGKLREGEGVEDAFRRAFLLLNKACYENFAVTEPGGRKGSQASTGNTSLSGGQFGSIPAQTAAVLRTGASAVVAYIVDKTLYVANAGLALAVVSKQGTAELLSHKHEPFDRSEAARIRQAEGWISPKGLLNEDLDMSRGFGFYHLLPSINARPDVRQWQLSESDEFVILANKGLWDFMSYQTAVDIARTEKDNPMMAAQKLRDFALGYGADGSIMVMIIGVGDLFVARGARTRQIAIEDASQLDSYYKQRQGRRGKDDIGDRTLARLDREIPPPTGMVALVFTDIKNSTSLWETNQGMQIAIKMHNALLRRQLRNIGGYEVKTEGDAFVVSFPTVAGALLWTFTCQLLLMQEDWPREILECEDGKEIRDEDGTLLYRGISVRMGIHWGNPVCEADPVTKRMDYFGPIVNRAARISGAADGGQITVSRDVVNEIQDVYDSLEQQVAVLEEVDGVEDQALAAEAALEAEEKLGPHISQLRKLGFRISYMGEKKLKGLETPEKLSLVYPTPIAARLNFTTSKPDIKAATIFEPKAGLVNVDEVRQLASLCLRLEALSSSGTTHTHSITHAHSHAHTHSTALTKSNSKMDNRASRYSVRNPDLLLPLIGAERTDDELLQILDSLSIRIENSLSTLYLKQLGGFSSVLAALTQATNVEPRLINHALALFGNLMNVPSPSSGGGHEHQATSVALE